MDRSWLREWLEGRFGRPLTRTAAPRRRKKRTQLQVELLEDRTLFATAIWSGAFNPTGNVAPPSPFPTMPPFPPTPPTPAGFAQPYWSYSQNWVNGYIPQNGDDIVFPVGVPAANKQILPLVNNAFQTFGSLAFYNSVNDLPGLTTLGSITIQDDGFRIGYSFGNPTPTPWAGLTGGSGGTIILNKGIIADASYEANGVTAGSYPTFIDMNFNLAGDHQDFTVVNAGAILEIGHQAVLSPAGFLSPGGEMPDARIERFTGAAGTLANATIPSGVVKQGLGTLKLSGSNIYTNLTEVDAGTLSVATLPSNVGANTKVLNGGSLMLQAGASISLNNTLTIQGGGVTAGPMAGGGAMQTDKIIESSGIVAVPGTWNGNVVLLADTTFGSFTLFPTPDTLTVGSATTAVTGPGGIVKVGTGRLTLPGNNTYQGSTTINQGALRISNNNSLGATAAGTTVASGATLEAFGTITSNEPITVNGSGVTNVVNYESALFGASGNPTLAGPVTVATDSTVGTTLGLTITLSGPISGSSNLSETLPGTVAITNPNNSGFTGVFSSSNGFLLFTSGGAFGNASNVLANNGGTIQVEGTFTTPVAVPLTLNGLGAAGLGALESKNAVAEVQTVTVTGGAGTFTLTFNGQTTAPLAFNATTATVQAALNGLSSISAGSGSVAVTGTPSNYTITFGGTLFGIDVSQITATPSGGASTVVGTVTNGSHSDITWAGTVTLGSTASIGTDLTNISITIAGSISGPASANLEKAGLGIVTLAGPNPNFLGGTTIRLGTLAVSDSLALGPTAGSQVQVFSGATLRLTNNVNINKTLALTGMGALGSLGALESLTGNNTLSGNVNLADPSNYGLNANGVTQLGAFVGINPGTQLTVSGVISGISMTIVRNGTLILAGSSGNTFSGTIVADGGGEIRLAKTSGLAISGSLTIGDNSAPGVTTVTQGSPIPPAVNEVQTVSTAFITGQPGGFTLTFTNGPTTSTTPLLAWGASAATVAAALNSTAFAAIGGSGASVTVTSAVAFNTTTYTITFSGGTLAATNVNQIIATTLSQPVVVRYFGSDQIADSGGNVNLNASGLLDLNGFSDVVEHINLQSSPTTTTAVSNIITGAGVLTVNGGLSVNPLVATAPGLITGNVAIGNGTQTFSMNRSPTLLRDLIIDGVVSGSAAATMDITGTTEVQTLTIHGAATATFTLTFNGFSTAPLAFTATAATVQAALNALPSIGGVGGSVAVSLSGTTYTITFGGTLTGVDVPAVTATFAGPAATALVITGTPGGAGPPPVNEFQQVQITFVGAPQGGFTFTFTNPAGLTSTTPGLAFGANAAAVQAALNALPSISAGGGSVSVISFVVGNIFVYNVTFDGGPLAATDVNQLVVAVSVSSDTITQGAAGVNEVQTVTTTLNGAQPPGFTLTFNASTTPALAFGASAATVQAALNLLPSISVGGGSVSVTAAFGPGATVVYTITFDGGPLAGTNVNQITAAVPAPGLATGAAVTTVDGGSATLLLTGTAPNTFAGTTITRGVLELRVAGGTAIAGPLVIFGVARDLLDNQLNNAPVTLLTSPFSTGLLDLNNRSDTVGLLTMTSGSVTTGATGLLTLGGNVITNAAATPATITGNLNLGPATRTFTVAAGTAVPADLVINGVISNVGGAGLTKAGAGTMQLTGTSANTYTGTTTVNDGTLLLAKTVTTVPGNLVIGDGVGTANSAIVQLGIAEIQTVTIGGNPAGTFTLTFNGSTTAALSATATAAAVQAALNSPAFASIGGVVDADGVRGSVAVTLVGTTYTITFGGALGGSNQNQITAAGAGGTTVAFATIQDGGAANQIAGTSTVTLFNDGELRMRDNGVGFSTLTMYGGTINTGVATGTTLTLNSDVAGGLAPGTSLPTQAFITGSGRLSLGGVSRTFAITNSGSTTATTADMTVNVPIIDGGPNPAGVVKIGTGSLVFAGANTYSGQTVVNAGVLRIQNNSALGTSGTVTVANFAALQLAGGITVTGTNAKLNGDGGQTTPNGAMENVIGNNTWAGRISLDSNSSIGVDVTSRLTVTDVIGGVGSSGLTKVGTGTLIFNGAASNTYQGTTTVNSGVLQLNMTTVGALAVPGDLVIGDGLNPTTPFSDLVQLLTNTTFNAARTITINSTGRLDLNGRNTTIGPLTLNAGNVFTNGGTLTLANTVTTIAAATSATIDGGAAGGINLAIPTTFNVARGTGVNPNTTLIPDLVVSAIITGPSQMSKTGSGIMVLTRDNTYAGPTVVNAGTLLIDGNQGTVPTLVQGGTLGGSGTSGNITASGGIISPGDAPTSLTPGILRVTGNVALGSASTLNILIAGNSSSPGSDFSQLNVTGGVNLNSDAGAGSTLTVQVSVPNLAINIPLTIIQAGAAGVLNTFRNPATFTSNARTYSITYNPTNVVLTHLSDISQTAVTSNANPSVFGQSVILTATVSSPIAGVGTPAGTVVFRDNGVAIPGFPPQTLNASGQASITVSNFSVGTHPITAQYTPATGSSFSPSTSPVMNQLVNQGPTSMTLTGNPPSPVVFGQPVTFTATLTVTPPAVGTPTGNIVLLNGVTILQSQPVPATGPFVVTFNVSNLPVGVGQQLTATYTGDTNFAPSVSTPLPYTVNQASTTTTLSANAASPLVFQQTVTFTAVVSPNAPGAGTPTGNVNLIDGATILQTKALPANGVVTFTVSNLGVGTGHVLVASYVGDTNFSASNSPPQAFTVNPAATSTGITANVLSPLVYGQTVNFTVTVAANFPGASTPIPPTGTVALMDGATVIQTQNLPANGTVVFAVNNLAVGSGHVISAAYSGDANFITSTSPSQPYTVNQDPTTTTLVGSAPSPLVFGQSLTLTATVTPNAPGSGIPTGTVQLRDGATVIQTQNLPSSGQINFVLTGLSLGNHAFAATYSGDGNFVTSASPTLNYVVNQDPTTTTLTASAPSPLLFGQSVTFTATVTANAPGSGTPTGTVTLRDNATVLQTQNLPASGQISFVISNLSVGSGHSITATYSGDANFFTSASAAIPYTVNVTPTTTTLTGVPPSPLVFGQSLVLTSTTRPNAPGGGSPQGTVTLFDNGNQRQSQNLPANGIATFNVSGLPVGAHSFTTTFTDTDGNYTNSNSGAGLSYTVNKSPTTTTLAGVPSSPVVFSQSVTFTVTVAATSPGSGIPAGTVALFDGTTQVGASQTLSPTGTASFLVSNLPVGSHSFTATYTNTDNNYLNSTSTPALAYTVNSAPTTTTLSSTTNPTVFGQATTFSVTVAANTPATGVPVGSVALQDTFNGQTTILATQNLSATGTASFNISNLAVGAHQVAAVFTPSNNNYATSTSTAVAQTVNTAGTTATLTPSANPAVFGQPINFVVTINVTSPGAGTPQGSVVLRDTFNGNTTTLGTQNLTAGSATFTIANLAIGTHSLVATYTSANNSFASSTTAAVSEVINKSATQTTVVASSNPATFGQTLTITATAAASPPGAGALTGTISFFDGATGLGTQPIGSAGTASIQVANFGGGTHNITGAYSGDGNFLTSTSANLPLVVNPAPTTTGMALSTTQTVFGQNVTVFTTVRGALTPVGTVTLLDGGNAAATQTLDANGQAVFNVATFAPGQHSLSILFNGTNNFAASASPPALLNVSVDSTALLLASSSPSATSGRQTVTFTALVVPTPPGSGLATGTATFFDGSAVMGVFQVVGGQATFSISNLLPGVHNISASYSGNANFAPSTSATIQQFMHAPNIIVTGADAGGGPNVLAFDADNRNVLFNFFAYDPLFTGGVRVATGDVNGDGFADMITAPGPGGGPHIKVFDGRTGGVLQQFFAFNPLFTGGSYVGSGDVNGDGFGDIIIGADSGGGPNVVVFSGLDNAVLMNFFAYSPSFTGGVRVAAGDTNADGRADVICGAGPGGGPNVTVFSGADASMLLSFFAYEQRVITGLYVGAGDVNGDGRDDIITGPGPQRKSLVTLQGFLLDPTINIGPNVGIFSGADGVRLASYFAYDPLFGGGVRVAGVRITGSGHADIVTTPGPGGGPDVRTVDGVTLNQIDDFFAYSPAFTGGLYVAASRL